jgi:hypothetical protein
MSEVTVILKDVEVGASKILGFLAKEAKAQPVVIAALGVVLGGVSKAVLDVQGAAAAGGVNISLDETTVADLKTVWPEMVKFAATLGIKL